MHWTKDISSLFDSLRELSRHWEDVSIRRIMAEGTPDLSKSRYDNWNGGTRYHTLAIRVPVHLYAAIESGIEAVEAEILKKIQKLQRGETNEFIDEVLVQPTLSPGNVALPSQDSGVWSPGHFRLFISHLTKDKHSAGNLKRTLDRYGISAFVAHEDIKPTKEWQDEIEKALFSMDSLAAILSPGFRESNWTDHEIGVALGRGVLVVPIRYGLDPYGLIAKYQGIQAKGKRLREVAECVFEALLRNKQTRGRLVSCLVEQFVVSGSRDMALTELELLRNAEKILPEDLAKIREKTSNSDVLANDEDMVERVNELLAKHGAELVSPRTEPSEPPQRRHPVLRVGGNTLMEWVAQGNGR